MNIALYARKSKGKEAPEVQLKRLRVVAEAERHTIVLERADIATGRNPNRPGWQEILSAVRGGSIRSVWMTKTDRAMRSARHYLTTVEEVFLPRGCQLRVLDQPMASITDHHDPLAVAFRTIGAAFAQLEVDLADERSNEGHQIIDGRTYGPSGTPVGRPVEFGEGHKFRVRNGRREHNRANCAACRGGTGGQMAPPIQTPKTEGAGQPFGFPMPFVGSDGRPSDAKIPRAGESHVDGLGRNGRDHSGASIQRGQVEGRADDARGSRPGQHDAPSGGQRIPAARGTPLTLPDSTPEVAGAKRPETAASSGDVEVAAGGKA